VREADGLAISSRNRHLDAEARGQATALFRALDAAERAAAAGERDAARLLRLAETEIEKAARAEIDYVELRDPESLASSPPRLAGPALAALAGWFRIEPGSTEAKVRLIDNRVLHVQHQQEDPQ
jgi:pantoate--beta-alanine ligase